MRMSNRTADLEMARWLKLRDGSWGIVVPTFGDEVKAGDKVRVHKRDGRWSVRTIDRVLWRGPSRDGSGVDAICTVLSRQDIEEWQDDLEAHGYSHMRAS